MRFNLHENASVMVVINSDHVMTKQESLAKYQSILEKSEILFERRHTVRRVLIIKHQEEYYLVSVIGNEKFNELYFYRIEKEDIDEIKVDVNKRMDKEDLKYAKTGAVA